MAGGPGITLEQFKENLPLGEIVGRYVRLTRAGRELKGLCPFHQEKTPSFSVVEDKGFYHCFGCGAHGNAIDFVMAIEGLAFADALVRLSEMTGIEAPRREGRNTPRQDPGLVDACAAAARYFAGQLASREGMAARRYLQERGVGERAIETFQLGHAGQERQGLKDWLAAQGINASVAARAGLIIEPDGGGESFDRFRQRLMIPIEDHRGRIVGFGGRALASQKAKYLNSPETDLFHKGSLLFNLKRAAPEARKRERLLIVEGYMDVIALAQAGLTEAVAPLGTAVTEEQLQLMWRVCARPVVCLDGDRAGQGAALRLARRALPVMRAGQALDFVMLPDGEDPDSLVRARGVDALEGLVRTAIPLSRLLWQMELNAAPADTPEQHAALKRRLLEHVASAGDDSLRQALRDQFFALLDARRPQRQWRRSPVGKGGDRAAFATARRPGLAQGPGGKWDGVGANALSGNLQQSAASRDLRLVGYFLRFPELLEQLDEELSQLVLADAEADQLRQEILVWYGANEALDVDNLRHHLTEGGFERVVARALGALPAEFSLADVNELLRREWLNRARMETCDRLAKGVAQREQNEFALREADELFNHADIDRTGSS